MRRGLVLLLALFAATAGCFDWMADRMDEAREDAGDPAPQESTEPASSAGAWPRAGSRVSYEVQGGQGSASSWATRIDLTYDGAVWRGECEGARAEQAPDGLVARRRYDEAVAFAPPAGPIDVAPGQPVGVLVPSECGLRALSLLAQGRFPEDATREGRPVRVTAWWADEGAAREPQVDEDAWWDAETGLLLRWEAAEHATDVGFRGRLVDTDAPLG